jgi:hypothetical protein
MRDRLKPYGLLRRLENSCDLGTPDVLYTLKFERPARHDVRMFDVSTGLIELKEDEWPVKPSTPLLINSLTRDQVLWQMDWERSGGKVATLAKIGQDYLWLRPEVLREVFRRALNKEQCKQFVIGSGAFPTTAVLKRML